MLLTATMGASPPTGMCDGRRIAGGWANARTPTAAEPGFAMSGITPAGTDVADGVEVHDFFTGTGRIGYEDLDFGAPSVAPAVTSHDSPGGPD